MSYPTLPCVHQPAFAYCTINLARFAREKMLTFLRLVQPRIFFLFIIATVISFYSTIFCELSTLIYTLELSQHPLLFTQFLQQFLQQIRRDEFKLV